MNNSHYYFKYPAKIDDRLDENYNDPSYDEIEQLLLQTRFEILQLSDSRILQNITSGKTPRGIHYLDEGGVPFLGASSIANEKVLVDDAPCIQKKLHESILKSSQIKKENVLITMAGTIGRCATYKTDEECNCNQAIAILQLNSDHIIPEFLTKYLNSKVGQLFFGKLQHISSQPNINTTEIGRINVICPPRHEQEKILKQVVEQESALIPIEREIEKLEERKNDSILDAFGLMKWKNRIGTYFFKEGKSDVSLFFMVDFKDLEDRLNYLFYDTRQKLLEEFTEKYSTTTLKNIVTKPIMRGIQPDYMKERGILVIKTVDLNNGYIDYENCLKTSEDSFEKSPDAQIIKDDVLIASTGYVSLGKIDVYDRDEKAIVDGHISILRLRKGYDPHFIASFLRSHLGKIQFEKWWSGSSGQIELQPSDLENVIIPDNAETGVLLNKQKNISNQIKELSFQIEELHIKKNQIKNDIQQFFEKSLYN